MSALKATAEAGIRPAVLSSLVLAEGVANGKLVVVPTGGLDLRRKLRLVQRPCERLSPVLREVVAATGAKPRGAR